MTNAVLTVSKQLENNEGENDWARKQEGRVCSCALGWAENRRLTQPESDRERAVGENKVEQWDDAENSWRNAHCAFLCVWGLLRSRVKVGA